LLTGSLQATFEIHYTGLQGVSSCHPISCIQIPRRAFSIQDERHSTSKKRRTGDWVHVVVIISTIFPHCGIRTCYRYRIMNIIPVNLRVVTYLVSADMWWLQTNFDDFDYSSDRSVHRRIIIHRGTKRARKPRTQFIFISSLSRVSSIGALEVSGRLKAFGDDRRAHVHMNP